MYSFRAFAFLSLLVVQISALSSDSGFGKLLARQSFDPSSIPEACQSTCAPIMSTISSCTELSCLCNNDVAKEIADCADCLFAVSNDSSLLSQDQSIIDQYNNACATSGEPISSVQIPSANPSATSGSSGSSGASATSTSASSTSSSSSSQESSAAIWSSQVGFGTAMLAGVAAAILI